MQNHWMILYWKLMLNESHEQNDTLCMSPFTWLPGTGEIKAKRKQTSGFGRGD